MLLFAVLVSAVTIFAQEQSLKKKNVPKAILEAFHKSYSKAVIKGYSSETDEGKTHRDISYTADGTVVSVEESFSYKDLPEPVRNTMMKNYPKAKVSICEKVTKGFTTQFELLIQSGKKKLELVFNPDGTLVEQEKK